MPNLVKTGPVVLEEIFRLNVFYYFCLEICVALHLNKLESPSPNDALVEIGPVVLEKKIKM